MSDTKVWVKTRANPGSSTSVHIHRDPDCQALGLAHSVKRITRSKLPTDWPDCSLCTETSEKTGGVPAGEDPQARRKQLQALDPDEVGL